MVEHHHAALPTKKFGMWPSAYKRLPTPVLEEHKYVHLIELDFSKAFDSVRHSTLIKKITPFPIPSNVHSWLVEYLNSRQHCTNYKSVISTMLQKHKSPYIIISLALLELFQSISPNCLPGHGRNSRGACPSNLAHTRKNVWKQWSLIIIKELSLVGWLVSGRLNGYTGGQSDGGWLDSKPAGWFDRPTDQIANKLISKPITDHPYFQLTDQQTNKPTIWSACYKSNHRSIHPTTDDQPTKDSSYKRPSLEFPVSGFDVPWSHLSQVWGHVTPHNPVICAHGLTPTLKGQFGEILLENSSNASNIIKLLLFWELFQRMSSQCSPSQRAVMGWNRELLTPPGFSHPTPVICSHCLTPPLKK